MLWNTYYSRTTSHRLEAGQHSAWRTIRAQCNRCQLLRRRRNSLAYEVAGRIETFKDFQIGMIKRSLPR